jgi:DNA-directed RNA polymerase specialized sigma24 family protein
MRRRWQQHVSDFMGERDAQDLAEWLAVAASNISHRIEVHRHDRAIRIGRQRHAHRPDFAGLELALDGALDARALVDERKMRVVEMRYFGGLTVEQTADALGVSTDTVKRDWRLAQLWLLNYLEEG